MSGANYEKEIKSLVTKILEIDESKLGLDVKFVEDLDMDSMRALEILAAIEKKYRIEIPEEQLVKMTTLRDVIGITTDYINASGA